jgi:hypothetical protein
MKLQASEPSGSESLQSQTRPCPKNRPISRLGVVHRRLNRCNGAGNDIAQHRQPVLNGDLSDWTILQASSGAFRESWFEDRGFFLSVTGGLLSFIRGWLPIARGGPAGAFFLAEVPHDQATQSY